MPFYYIEYGLARLAALQVWRDSLRNPSQALARFREALALGSSRALPEVYAAAGATGPSLFTAIQQQLGLRLEARRGPVPVLVIDHAEKVPAEN